MRKLRPVALAVLAATFLMAGEARVTILQTTDLHGHARGAGHLSAAEPALGGYPRIAAYVKQARAACGHPVLLVDSGDWSMGTLYDLDLSQWPLPLWFADTLGYDCITLGNHDFDYGWMQARKFVETARYPVVSANLVNGAGNYDFTMAVDPTNPNIVYLGGEGLQLSMQLPIAVTGTVQSPEQVWRRSSDKDTETDTGADQQQDQPQQQQGQQPDQQQL